MNSGRECRQPGMSFSPKRTFGTLDRAIHPNRRIRQFLGGAWSPGPESMGHPVTQASLVSDRTPPPSRLEVGPLSIIVINAVEDWSEGPGPGVSVAKNPSRPRSFSLCPSWRIEGRLSRFASPQPPGPGRPDRRDSGFPRRVPSSFPPKRSIDLVAVEPGETSYHFVMLGTKPPAARPRTDPDASSM